jgi:hypothetical protein
MKILILMSVNINGGGGAFVSFGHPPSLFVFMGMIFDVLLCFGIRRLYGFDFLGAFKTFSPCI